MFSLNSLSVRSLRPCAARTYSRVFSMAIPTEARQLTSISTSSLAGSRFVRGLTPLTRWSSLAPCKARSKSNPVRDGPSHRGWPAPTHIRVTRLFKKQVGNPGRRQIIKSGSMAGSFRADRSSRTRLQPELFLSSERKKATDDGERAPHPLGHRGQDASMSVSELSFGANSINGGGDRNGPCRSSTCPVAPDPAPTRLEGERCNQISSRRPGSVLELPKREDNP